MFIAFLSVLFSCAEMKQKENDGEGLTIDFQDLRSVKSSDIVAERSFIKLETSAESLIGKINQIEIVDDCIYILDEEKTNSIFVFSMQGQLLQKLSAKGNGPGEFAMPYSFKNPRSPGNSFCSCWLIASIAPLPQKPSREFLET